MGDGRMQSKKLSEMKSGEQGIVEAVHGHGNISHRLVDMGIVKGSHIRIEKLAPLGDPVEVKVKGCALALRMREADLIDVNCSEGE